MGRSISHLLNLLFDSKLGQEHADDNSQKLRNYRT
jgi:hypothetical protein